MHFGKIGTAVFLSMIFAGNVALTHLVHKDDKTETQVPASKVEIAELSYTRYVPYEVPTGDTSFKSYMDYRTITNTRSKQYDIQQHSKTDADGLRYYGSYYVVALGTFYSDTIGTRVRITLDTGVQFYAIVGDIKANCDTDKTNRYSPMAEGRKNVVEFIVDTDVLDRKAKMMGDISYVEGDEFKGNVTKIERIQE